MRTIIIILIHTIRNKKMPSTVEKMLVYSLAQIIFIAFDGARSTNPINPTFCKQRELTANSESILSQEL